MSREQTRRSIAEGLSPGEAGRAARLPSRGTPSPSANGAGTSGCCRGWTRSCAISRFGIRMLRKDAVVTGAAVASLALAMGAAIAAFVLIDALILRPLPVRHPERLVYLFTEDTANRGDRREIPSFSYPTFISLQKAASGRAGLFAATFDRRQAFPIGEAIRGDERVYAQKVSGNAFAELGRPPALGRLLVPSRPQCAGRASGGCDQRRCPGPVASAATAGSWTAGSPSHARVCRLSVSLRRDSPALRPVVARTCGCRRRSIAPRR